MMDNTRFSDVGQGRIDALLSQADSLFDYQWMRKDMFAELRKSVVQKGGYPTFSQQMQEQKELMFIAEYFLAYRSQLPSIIDECANPYEDEDIALSLLEERELLIREYAAQPLSRDWTRVRAAFPDSWRAFARRRDLRDEKQISELRKLLRLVDKISLISDILNKREGCYGITLNYTQYKRNALAREEDQKLSRQDLKKLLLKAIDASRDFFWGNSSMAVVQAICNEDYGFGDNISDFERFMQEVLQDLEPRLSFGCPLNTIASARSSNEYLKHPISSWASFCTKDLRPMRLLTQLRTQLDRFKQEI